MASVEKISEKLSKILKKKQGCAIALTDEWGIGKTHFWKMFQKEHLKDMNTKIAYVSLFGIETLDVLKYEIGIQTQSSSVSDKDNKENLKVKNFFTNITKHIRFPELESNGFVLSIGQQLIGQIIGGMVTDTIICIDDLERKSDKLELKDIMGLISQLKTEKNCQIIVILHQDKADKQFQEYKEKVFDEFFYLTENFAIIQEIINDNEMIDVYQEFYNKLQIKNLRFYERVKKDYQEIIELANNLTITSKDRILRNLLMIRLADYHPCTIVCEDEKYTFEFNLDFILNFNDGYLLLSR